MNSGLWWKDAIIYEVYVDKFAKNFRGMARKLPYLKNLGVNCVWLLPHYPSPMVDGGYDVSDFMNVREELGTLEDFKNFTKTAHRAGIWVIVDLVLNHVSIQHPWFIEAASSLDNPKRNYFLWSKTGEEFSGAYNPFSHMTAGNWILNEKTGDYYFATFFKEQADLNWDNPAVFAEITKIIDFWTNLGVDGFRLDAAGHLIKREGTDCRHLPETHLVIKNLRKRLNSNHPGVIMLAEAGGRFDETVKYFGDGDECHMVFHFELMSKIYLSIKRSDSSIVRNVIKKSAGIPKNCQWATFISNHDEITFTPLLENERLEILNWLDPEGKYSFRGGRGTSMRLATVFSGDQEKILGAFEILFGFPGAPVIYYGSEIGMKNLELLEPPRDTRFYVRGEFDWGEAGRQEKDPGSLLNRLKKLIKERR